MIVNNFRAWEYYLSVFRRLMGNPFSMKTNDLKERTALFFVNVSTLLDELPAKKSTEVVSSQLLRSSSSIGANYRAACRAKSGRDFINKLKIVEEETDESLHWLEIIKRLQLVEESRVRKLIEEADELVAIFVASIRTAKINQGIPVYKSPEP
jgi:four helix bundle protein